MAYTTNTKLGDKFTVLFFKIYYHNLRNQSSGQFALNKFWILHCTLKPQQLYFGGYRQQSIFYMQKCRNLGTAFTTHNHNMMQTD